MGEGMSKVWGFGKSNGGLGHLKTKRKQTAAFCHCLIYIFYV